MNSPVTDGPEHLFANKTWLGSDQPLHLSPALLESLDSLGDDLLAFTKACNSLYQLSAAGRQPSFVAEWLDRGKPASLVAAGRAKPIRNAIPRVIRPDILLTNEGLRITEIDSLPGGIGLTAALHQQHERAGNRLWGSSTAFLEGFRSIVANGTILVSQEASTYLPEMQWIASKIGASVIAAEGASLSLLQSQPATYRFFELFDLANIPGADALVEVAALGAIALSPPPKAFMEEKMWFAFLRSRPLQPFWRRTLGDRIFHRLLQLLPETWIIDPEPLPPQAVYPGLQIHSWDELRLFSQKERQLVLKRSGFSEDAWGSRSVTIGHDVSQTDWSSAIDHALRDAPTRPFILQRFHKPESISHPMNSESRFRIRLCPFYFVDPTFTKAKAAGALATLCAPDKKIIHGMEDATLVPIAPAT
jgi:hypothetical protein